MTHWGKAVAPWIKWLRASLSLYTRYSSRHRDQELCRNITVLLSRQKSICLALLEIYYPLNTMLGFGGKSRFHSTFMVCPSSSMPGLEESLCWLCTLTQEYFFSILWWNSSVSLRSIFSTELKDWRLKWNNTNVDVIINEVLSKKCYQIQ